MIPPPDLKRNPIIILQQNLHAAPVQAMVHLIDVIITETRIDNDTATVKKFWENKGKLNGLKLLRDYILKPMPTLMEPK